MLKIITLKNNGDVESLINNNFNGINTRFIIPDLPKNKKEKLIKLLSILKDNLPHFEILYEGKINYSFRNKRIDIVLYKSPFLFLGTIPNEKKIDKVLLELDNLINLQKSKQVFEKIKLIGCLFLEKPLKKEVLESIKKLVSNQFLFLLINDTKHFELIYNYVISNQ